MSLQVFLQAQLLGSENFLSLLPTGKKDSANDLVGRCTWLTLFAEVLPRALLAELKLSRMLLGSSSAEQFLLILPEEDTARAHDFLVRVAASIAHLSTNTLRLVWATTENLGAWPVVRKRLDDVLSARICCPLPEEEPEKIFAPFEESAEDGQDAPFAEFAAGLISAGSIGWSAGDPLLIAWNAGEYSWPLCEHSSAEEDGILFPRRFAMNDADSTLASSTELAERAEGADRWGILRGDVDHFELQLRRAASIEEHIHFSALFKEFFAGELSVLCALPDFWRKITVLYRGGDDFAVIGSWDALIHLAREIQRVFETLVEQHLAELPGVEAKSISMALAIAPDPHSVPAAVFAQAGAELRTTKSAELGSIYLFGRTLEWKRLNEAEELKASLVRLVREHRYPASYLNELAAVYRESFSARAARRGKALRADKPWRTYMKLSRVIPAARGRDQSNLRNSVITSLTGKRAAGLKLRPSIRVGLEWARLSASA